ncbi:MAG: hypothetical protein JWL92_381 [Candidatus Nomurabacteria bacterium]|nr:hypothetical protein [Candidatus Nomurabacteria bacterium]
MNETETPTLTERIIEAIVVHGGIAEDVEYLSNEAVHALGLNLAQAGIKARTPNPAFVVIPLNDLKGNMDNFKWVRNHLAKLKFNVESTDGPKIIELIKCKPGKTEAVLKEINENGFIPAPSPYVLGLGVQYPDVIKEYGRIISLDEQNVLLRGSCDPCFLYLYWDGLRNLSLTKRAGWWDDRWWFAVVRK